MELSYEGFTQRLKDDGELEKLAAFDNLYQTLKGDWVKRTLFVLNSISAYFGIANLKAESESDKKWFEFLKSPTYAGSFSPKVNYEQQ